MGLPPTRVLIAAATPLKFVLELLLEEKVLLVQGSGFNWPEPDHLRVVFLPHEIPDTEKD